MQQKDYSEMLTNYWRDANIRYAPATDTGGQTGDTGETPNAATDPASGETPTAEQLLAELEQTRAALKKANSEAAANRVKAKKLEDEEEQRKQAEMTALEKAQKAEADAKAKLEQYQAQVRSERIRHAVEMAATKLNFHDPADARALADLSTVEVGEDGTVSGAEEALKALAKAKPHLVKSETQAPDINANQRGRTTAPSIDDLKRSKLQSGAYTPI